MNQFLTEIVCILDRSGSMQPLAKEGIGGFNAFIDEQKKVEGEAKVTVVGFDNEYEIWHNGVPINDLPPLDKKTFVPRGMTALNDAIGRTINLVGERLEDTSEQERPGQVIFVVLTDGMENASKEFNLEQVAGMIKHQQEKYSWEFIYLAANVDAQATGAALNFMPQDTQSYEATEVGMRRAYVATSMGVTAKRSAHINKVKN